MITFQIGQNVRVRDEYMDNEVHRKLVGEIVGTEINTDVRRVPFTDYIVKFPDGQCEPFGAWELVLVNK